MSVKPIVPELTGKAAEEFNRKFERGVSLEDIAAGRVKRPPVVEPKQLSWTDTDWREYVGEPMKKSVEQILEAGKRMYEFKQQCQAKQGGSSFAKEAQRVFGMSKDTSHRWSQIGAKVSELSQRCESLPMSHLAICEIAQLPDLSKAIKAGVVKPDATVSEIKKYKASLKAPAPKKEPAKKPKGSTKRPPIVIQEMLDVVMPVLDAMNEDTARVVVAELVSRFGKEICDA